MLGSQTLTMPQASGKVKSIICRIIILKIFQFRTWQANPTKLLGFVNRRVSLEGQKKLKYSGKTQCSYNMILGAAIFYHRFYQYVTKVTRNKSNKINVHEAPSFQQYTYIQPSEIRVKVEELFNCEDIFINAMIADLTMQPGVMMRLKPGSPAPQCTT